VNNNAALNVSEVFFLNLKVAINQYGNALRAVLGSNDGLVSNMSLVMGVAGAVSNNTILLTELQD
jgi:VIT1/CCC1 family predicted Fe2+/Mn2+ transporter